MDTYYFLFELVSVLKKVSATKSSACMVCDNIIMLSVRSQHFFSFLACDFFHFHLILYNEK
jgi:hypothetical protein